MASRTSSRTLTVPERRFWQEAFLAAHRSFLLRRGTMRTAVRAAELAADYADASVAEFRRRVIWRSHD